MQMKDFFNRTTNKHWQIEIDGQTIRTCLNGGKIKEIFCDSDFQVRNKASSLMMGQMRKGFVFQDPKATFGKAKCHRFVGKDSNGFMPLATSVDRDDFFLTRMVGDFQDEQLYHFDINGEILETISLGPKRMTYEQVLCPNDRLLLNNSYLLEQFSFQTRTLAAFANKKNSMRTMLDAAGDLVLWYTGEEIIVANLRSDVEVLRQAEKCKKSKDPGVGYYCQGVLSPLQTKLAYRVTESEYVLVDLKSSQSLVIANSGWHPFFSPDDQFFSVGGKFYQCSNGKEIENPFPFSILPDLQYSDTCAVKSRNNLMAVQQGRGNSPVEIWDLSSAKILASIKDPFVVREVNFDFTKNNLVMHTDYGAMSIYQCSY